MAMPLRIATLVGAAMLALSGSAARAGDSASHQAVQCEGETATIVGTAGEDVLTGTEGNDVIHGLGGTTRSCLRAATTSAAGRRQRCPFRWPGSGNDFLTGGLGDDVLEGAEGIDTVYFLFSPQGVRASVAAQRSSGEGTDRFVSIEDLDCSRFADVLIGSARSNWLRGFNANDRLVGGGGRDRLQGQNGNDNLLGGGGNDLLEGGPGRDRGDGGPGRDRCVKVEQRRSCP